MCGVVDGCSYGTSGTESLLWTTPEDNGVSFRFEHLPRRHMTTIVGSDVKQQFVKSPLTKNSLYDRYTNTPNVTGQNLSSLSTHLNPLVT